MIDECKQKLIKTDKFNTYNWIIKSDKKTKY